MANEDKARVNFWVDKEIKAKWQKIAEKSGRNLTAAIIEAMHEWVLKIEPMTKDDLEIEAVKAELEKEKENNVEIVNQVQELLAEFRASRDNKSTPIHPELKDTILSILELNQATFDQIFGIAKVDENTLMDALADLQNQKLIKSINKEGTLIWGNVNA